MDDLVINKSVTIPGWELWFTASRSGGPGGQHANKASTRVQLHWMIEDSSVLDASAKKRLVRRLANDINSDGVLTVACAETRSQHRNRKKAREQLAALVRSGLARKKRRIKTKPSRSAKRRRLENKRKRGEKKRLRKNPKPRNWD
jgi:ribosome-associated protein